MTQIGRTNNVQRTRDLATNVIGHRPGHTVQVVVYDETQADGSRWCTAEAFTSADGSSLPPVAERHERRKVSTPYDLTGGGDLGYQDAGGGNFREVNRAHERALALLEASLQTEADARAAKLAAIEAARLAKLAAVDAPKGAA
jgi:hypothetical protein